MFFGQKPKNCQLLQNCSPDETRDRLAPFLTNMRNKILSTPFHPDCCDNCIFHDRYCNAKGIYWLRRWKVKITLGVDIMQVDIRTSEKVILQSIGMRGPMTGYDLAQETKYSDKTCYQGVNRLRDLGFLYHDVIAQTRAGMDKKQYGLTLRGLVALLWPSMPTEIIGKMHQGEGLIFSHDEFSLLLKYWSELIPLVLGKWDHFQKYDVEDLARKRLFSAGLNTPYPLVQPESLNPEERCRAIKDWFYGISAEDITWAFYDPSPGSLVYSLSFDSVDDYKRWNDACDQDEEIKTILQEILTRYISREKPKIDKFMELLRRIKDG